MTNIELLSKSKSQIVGKKPVVVLPLAIWQKIEDRLEDLVLLESKKLKNKIYKARSEKQLVSSHNAKKALGL